MNTSDPLFEIIFQLGEEKRRIKTRGTDPDEVKGKTLLHLTEKYQDPIKILSVEPVIETPEDNRPNWERIVDQVMKQQSHREDCESEKEAAHLVRKIMDEFERRHVSEHFHAISHNKAVHVFPVYYVKKGSQRWKEITGSEELDMGWYGNR